MKITILCVGKVKEKFYRDAIAEYSKRLSRYCKLEITEVSDEKTSEQATQTEIDIVKNKEGERLLKNIKDDAYVFCLAIDGKQLDSVELSQKMDKLMTGGKSHLVFVIGKVFELYPHVLRGRHGIFQILDSFLLHYLEYHMHTVILIPNLL